MMNGHVRHTARTGDEPVLDLGDFTPEQKTLRLNGIEYDAWVTRNRRYPRRIQARVDLARSRYLSIAEPLLAQIKAATPPPKTEDQTDAEYAEQLRDFRLDPEFQVWIEQQNQAYGTYVTESLCALIPDLDYDDAELIDLPKAEYALRELGYFKDEAGGGAESAEPDAEVDEDSPLAGATRSAASATSTLPTP